jgi:hypothetical protein
MEAQDPAARKARRGAAPKAVHPMNTNTTDNVNFHTNPPELTRVQAFDWLGKNHWIPANMGVRSINTDLMAVLEALPRGESITVDYRGSVPDAPHFTLERSVTDTLTLRWSQGPADAPRKLRKTWPPTDNPARNERIAYDILGLLLKARRAPGVVLVPPRD